MAKPRDTDLSRRYNRDEDLKIPADEGRAPRHATEPDTGKKVGREAKTGADPANGEPKKSRS